MARHDAYLDHLHSVPLFSQCTKKELEQVAQLVTPLTIHAGQTFIREGELARELMIIEKGTASVTKHGEEIAQLSDGAVVGELAVVLERHRNASVTAVTDIELLVIDSRSFSTLLDEVHGFARKLLHTIAMRLADQV
jgi:CRP-like cAMP-binding protein